MPLGRRAGREDVGDAGEAVDSDGHAEDRDPRAGGVHRRFIADHARAHHRRRAGEQSADARGLAARAFRRSRPRQRAVRVLAERRRERIARPHEHLALLLRSLGRADVSALRFRRTRRARRAGAADADRRRLSAQSSDPGRDPARRAGLLSISRREGVARGAEGDARCAAHDARCGRGKAQRGSGNDCGCAAGAHRAVAGAADLRHDRRKPARDRRRAGDRDGHRADDELFPRRIAERGSDGRDQGCRRRADHDRAATAARASGCARAGSSSPYRLVSRRSAARARHRKAESMRKAERRTQNAERRMKKWGGRDFYVLRSAFCVLRSSALAILVLGSLACAEKTEKPRDETVPVTVAQVVKKNVPLEIEAIGNVQPLSTVEIRALAGGQLMRVWFKEGDDVARGQMLFTIDPRPYQATLQQAQANLAGDEALLRNAESQQARYDDLVKKDYVTKEEYSRIVSAAEAARAVAAADRAAAENARLQLSYCEIRSPITGRTGGLKVYAGNLVKANDTTPLVVINQIEPVRVQ